MYLTHRIDVSQWNMRHESGLHVVVSPGSGTRQWGQESREEIQSVYRSCKGMPSEETCYSILFCKQNNWPQTCDTTTTGVVSSQVHEPRSATCTCNTCSIHTTVFTIPVLYPKWWRRQHVQGCGDLSLCLGMHGSLGEGMGGVWDAWITAVVGWLHGKPVGGNGQSG